METSLQVGMTQAPTTEMIEVLQRIGMVLSFLDKLMCWCGKKDCSWNTTHTTRFHNAYKQNSIIFAYLTLNHPYMMSLHKSNEPPPDIPPPPLSLKLSKLQTLPLQLELILFLSRCIVHQVCFCICLSKQVRETVYESRHCRAC